MENKEFFETGELTLSDLRKWVNMIPEQYLKYNVVCCKEAELTEEIGVREDMPVIGLALDVETKEVLIKISLDE